MTSNQAGFWWVAVTAGLAPLLVLTLAVLTIRFVKRVLG